MRQTLVWTIVFINLAAIATGLGYVIVRPAEVKAVSGLMNPDLVQGIYAKQVHSNSLKPSDSDAISDSPSIDNEPDVAEATGEIDLEAEGLIEVADVDENGVRRPPPKAGDRRPPTKSTGGSEEKQKRISEAEYLGPYLEEINVEAPAIALYPFRVDKRIFPPDAPNEVLLEIAMRNSSGYHWENAYIILKSADSRVPPQTFSVEEWRIDGIAMLKYQFPKEELQQRVKNLRVIAVYGDRRDSYLSDVMSETRTATAGTGPVTSTLQDDNSAADLLGIWNKTVTAIRSGDEADREGMELPRIEVSLKNAPAIPTDFSISEALASSNEKLATLAQNAHKKALEAEKEIKTLVTNINEQGYFAYKEAGAADQVEKINARMTEYNQIGVDLIYAITTDDNQDAEKLREDFYVMTDALDEIRETVERQVRIVDPEFGFES